MSDIVPRRSLLALLGGGTAALASRVAEGAPRIDAAKQGPPEPAVRIVHSLQALAAASATADIRMVLRSGGRSGDWQWRAGDYTRQIAADPLAGLYLPHATVPSGRGSWIREWDGVHGRAEWFGAQADDQQIDSGPAIQAALDLCPAVDLGPGSYHVAAGLRITKNGSRLSGAGISQTDQGRNDRATEIICSSSADTILQIGVDQSSQPSFLVEAVQLRDFIVRRAAPAFIPDEGLNGAIGIALRWCVNCHAERVFSIDSARGWFFSGVVETYVSYCSALRGVPGSRPRGDFFIGFHLDFSAPLAANGGNASLYLDHCRAFGSYGRGTPNLHYSAGLRTDGGWVDLYVNALETGILQYGIHGIGDGNHETISFKTEDLIITNCVLDSASVASIRLESAGTATAVQISNNYFAVAPGGISIALSDIGGAVTLMGNQCITGVPGGTGLSAVDVSSLRAIGNTHTRLKQPIYLERVSGFDIQDTVRSLDAPSNYPAITAVACRRGKIDCIVRGRPGGNSAGVAIRGGSSEIEVNCTNIDPAVVAGASRKLLLDEKPIIAAGEFGVRCLATGIMG